jgi:uncharacterized Zn finger protein
MAGGRSFERGVEYFERSRVGTLVEHEGRVTATVEGTHLYRVELRRDSDGLDYSCTCPVGDDGEFCKHCVAVGLAWLEGGAARVDNRRARSGGRSRRIVRLDDLREHVSAQSKEALVKLLLDQAMHDDALRRKLTLGAAKHRKKALDTDSYRDAIDEALDTGGFVDYYSVGGYAQGIDAAVSSIEELLKEGHAEEAIELCEHALKGVERAMGSIDDSDGQVGEILERLQALHHAACKKARPDPEELAERLFKWELETDWDTFYGAAETYADVLGKKGLAVYRALAEKEWAKVPQRKPGQRDAGDYGGRFRITSIMEMLARRTGDVEALVAVKKRTLAMAYDYLQIAETYRGARKHDLALEWAERGLAAFPEKTDSRLREFLAAEYHRRKRHGDAIALIWAEFVDSPGLESYRLLKQHADRCGEWAAWREKALSHLRALRDTSSRTKRPASIWSRADNSTLVGIFLWEKDPETAWNEAQRGGCSDELWMELAKTRERNHPDDAIAIYRRRIEPTLDRKNNDAYREAVQLLRRIRGLMAGLGREAEFAAYLGSLRTSHKPKRNFIKLLDHARW